MKEDKSSADFLVAEYNLISEALLRNEELGDRRVNIFISLMTAVLAALGALQTTSLSNTISFEVYLVLLFFGIGALLLFGSLTLVRILRRNTISDGFKKKLDGIRMYFIKNDSKISPYLPYDPCKTKYDRNQNWPKRFSWGTGGLTQTVVLLNSLIVASLPMLALIFYKDLNVTIKILFLLILGVAGFLISWLIQFNYVQKINTKREIETEAALIIYSDKPKEIADKLSELKTISGYSLIHKDPQTIHDVYFDTPARELQKKMFALRIRTIGKNCMITLKGARDNTISKDVIERIEIEELWSTKSLHKIMENLKTHGIMLSDKVIFDENSPFESMTKSGLVVIQNRTNNRRIRSVEQQNNTLAEFSIDDVVYLLGNNTVRIFQVEIEAKKDKIAVVNIVNDLRKTYGTKLKLWNYGKLATGFMITKLLDERKEDFIGKDGYLKSSGYDKIENYLKNPNF